MDSEKYYDWYVLEMKVKRKIKGLIESELEAYQEYEDDIGDVDSFEDGILEGRKEFAQELFDKFFN